MVFRKTRCPLTEKPDTPFELDKLIESGYKAYQETHTNNGIKDGAAEKKMYDMHQKKLAQMKFLIK